MPSRAFEGELGVKEPVQEPEGFWNPADFTADGSISMLANMGSLPGYLSTLAGSKFADGPNGLAEISKVSPLGWAQRFAFGGFVEHSGSIASYRYAGTPGDYGLKFLAASDPTENARKQSS